MIGDSLILQLDGTLSGASGVLLLFLAGLLARDHGRTPAARLGALFALGAAAFAVCSTAGFKADGSWWRAALAAVSAGNNVVFWLFARTLFDDDFRLRPWHAALWAAIASATLVCGLVLRPSHSALAAPVDAALALAALAFAALAVVQTVSSWPADLVERRRRLRVVVVGAAAGYTALTALTALAGLRGAGGPVSSAVGIAGAAGLAIITFGLAWSFLGVAGGDALFLAHAAAPSPPSAPDLGPADRQAVAAIERAMSIERAYRQDGLTIGALAAMHGMPEHRLRRLVNQGLGHRNFNSFLNSYRIADAKAGLADPDQAAVPILTVALDAGFSSLGPFNRAFKLDTGMTPSEFRRQALGRPAPGRPIVVSAGRIVKSARTATV